MSNLKEQQKIYRSKKWLTKDFITEEWDRLTAEDVDESVSQRFRVKSPMSSQQLSFGVKINSVKVSDGFDNILTYDKGQVYRNKHLKDFEFLDISWISSEDSVISVEDISPNIKQDDSAAEPKQVKCNCSRLDVKFISPKNISYRVNKDDSIEKISHDRRLSSVVILQKLQEKQMSLKK